MVSVICRNSQSTLLSFQTLDQDLQQELKGKVSTAIEGAQNVQMKEIRGLGDRLSGLEQLLLEAKRLVQEQQKLAAAFVQNQQRASGLRDVSILPDLCASHRQQLLVMQKNHQQIISICNRSGWLLFKVCSFSFGPNLSFLFYFLLISVENLFFLDRNHIFQKFLLKSLPWSPQDRFFQKGLTIMRFRGGEGIFTKYF